MDRNAVSLGKLASRTGRTMAVTLVVPGQRVVGIAGCGPLLVRGHTSFAPVAVVHTAPGYLCLGVGFRGDGR
jgi:hypothetical protein